jgi:hypothetical protein
MILVAWQFLLKSNAGERRTICVARSLASVGPIDGWRSIARCLTVSMPFVPRPHGLALAGAKQGIHLFTLGKSPSYYFIAANQLMAL